MLLAATIALAVTPTADASAADLPATSTATVLAADPAPVPNPSPSVPGIGLGPGAPTDPVTAPPPATAPGKTSGSDDDPSWYDIPGQIKKAIDDFFAGLVKDALNPVLALLGHTLLATPDVTTMSRVGQIWTGMAVLANSLYILFVLAGAVVIMTHETLQTRYAAKQIIPRLIFGFIAGNASLALFGLVIHVANIVSAGIMGQGLDPNQAGTALANMITGSITGAGGGIFLSILGLAVAGMAIVLLITYVVRVALAIILAVSAPLALSTLALPQTEGLARIWWRASVGTLAVQMGQSLTLIAGLQVLLDPGGVNAIGLPTSGRFVDLLVFLALFWILIRIPVWVSRMIFGRSHSTLMNFGKEVLAYKAMGMVGKAFKGRPQRSGPDGTVPPRAPSSALVLRPAGPGAGFGGGGVPSPGGWSPRPTTITVSRVDDGATAAGPRMPRPHGVGPRLAIGSGIVDAAGPDESGASVQRKALRPGVQDRLAARQRAAAEVPKPRYVQPGLFPPPPKTARPGPPSTLVDPPVRPARTGARQQALFSRPADGQPVVRSTALPPPRAAESVPPRPTVTGAPRMAAAPATPPPRTAAAAPAAASPPQMRATPAPAPPRTATANNPQPAAAAAPKPASPAPRAPNPKGQRS
ncbi:MAG: hypothetical protein ACJ786_00850 [Catenulispora sp.]